MTAQRTGKRIAVIATVDTKAEAARYLADQIRLSGVDAMIVDMSLTGESSPDVDIPRAELVSEGALDAVEVGRPRAMESMADAARRVLSRLVKTGAIDGAIGIGGGTGGWVAQQALDAMPFGFPRLVVTTVVKATGEADTLMMPSVVDVAGLNALLRKVLSNAAGAVVGMVVQTDRPDAAESTDRDATTAPARPVIAMTMFGVTTAGGDVARAELEAAGYDVVVFHATGAGGRTMERLADAGHFVGVLDWTTTELVQHLVGGLCDAGKDRMRGADGVPRVIVPGAVDVINVHPPVPDEFSERPLHWHLPTVPLVRSSAAEIERVGRWVGDVVREKSGPSVVLIPTDGFSTLDAPGQPFADPVADGAFRAGVEATAGTAADCRELLQHINDPDFARRAAQTLITLVESAASTTTDRE